MFIRAPSARSAVNEYSIQSTGQLGPLEDLLRNGFGARGALIENLMHVLEVCLQFGSLASRGGKVIPIILEKRFLEIAVAESSATKPGFEIPGYFGRRDVLHQLHGQIFIRIGF